MTELIKFRTMSHMHMSSPHIPTLVQKLTTGWQHLSAKQLISLFATATAFYRS